MLELLIGIALLVLLILFAGSGFTWLSRQSKQAKCVSNLRQLGALATLYSQDHQSRIVPWQTAPAVGMTGPVKLWSHYLLEASGLPGDWRVSGTLWYGSTVTPESDIRGRGVDFFRCPAQKDPFRIGYRLRYGINTTHAMNQPISRIKELSKAILIADSADANPDTIPYKGSFSDARGFIIQNNLGNPPGDRHGGGANVLFLDGHVENLPFYELITHPADSPQERARKQARWDQRQ